MLLLFVSSDQVRHHDQTIVSEPATGRRKFGVAPMGESRRSFGNGIFDGVSLRRQQDSERPNPLNRNLKAQI
ncbi:MAG: hypothetical protein JO355_00385 [Planctomycetaceae bacterium]|nr:hypothetical protein [Planctomycetaceae bacterium]MBV8270540.1 hypothetical protein [Planctomycetaceae bacterium]MBV8313847.1 hypothetical protein [Planctomycetaceae bacterium]MBV8557026.1 hypothetical protein [Planctomycetaceae bacterium]MBV8675605.1 hypothetical protein [Planctomycetaceae bacterium]